MTLEPTEIAIAESDSGSDSQTMSRARLTLELFRELECLPLSHSLVEQEQWYLDEGDDLGDYSFFEEPEDLSSDRIIDLCEEISEELDIDIDALFLGLINISHSYSDLTISH